MRRNKLIVLLSTITIATTLVACQNTQAQTATETSQVQSQQSPPAKPGGEGFGGSDQVTQGDAATNLTTDATVTGETYESTGDDENALRVTGATVTLDGVTVNKTAGATSNTENGDFYGMNAGFLATDGATVTIKNATVNTTITTTRDNSGGIQTTGGGTMNATNLTVNTAGNSSAAIRTDRGGGTVVVDKGTYTSTGYNSPAVYSTANVTVKNATLNAENSEALVIEGQNSITLENTNVTGNMSSTEGSSSDNNVHNVMIYQSMSGDAESGTATFTMKGGTLTGRNGDQIYVTNTHSVITLEDVTITNQDTSGRLLAVLGNDATRGWGTAGANGGQVELTTTNQTLTGAIEVDTVSTLNFTMGKGTNFTGTINIVENAEGGTVVDNNAVITVEEGATWTLTGNVKITSLTNKGTINLNGYTITLADGTVLK